MLLLFFEGVYFSCLYSAFPFLAYDILQKPLLLSRVKETNEQMEFRYVLLSGLAFVFFYFYTKLGLRTRYVLWHLQQKRYASGFTPVETLCVSLYHTVFLGVTTDLLLPYILPTPSPLILMAWYSNTWIRMKNIFFLSILQHTFLELSGVNDKIRKQYFEVDRH